MKRNLTLTAGTLMSALLAANLRAQAPAAAAFDSTVNVGVDVATAYIFRGATVYDKPVAQPYMYANIVEGLTLGAWSTLGLDDSNPDTYGEYAGDVGEVDLSAEYALPVGKCPLGVSVIYTEYLYTNGTLDYGTEEAPDVRATETDREVGLKLALNTNCALDNALSPTLAVYYGLDGAIDSSLYSELGLGHEFADVAEGVSLSLGGTLGYLEPDEGDSGLSNATLSAGLKVGVASLKVTYVIETDDDVLAVDEEVIGTLGLSKTF